MVTGAIQRRHGERMGRVLAGASRLMASSPRAPGLLAALSETALQGTGATGASGPTRLAAADPPQRHAPTSARRAGVPESAACCRPLRAPAASIIRHQVPKWLTGREACKLYATGVPFCSTYILLRLNDPWTPPTDAPDAHTATLSPPRRHGCSGVQSPALQEAEVGALAVLAVRKFRADRKRVLRTDIHRLSRHQLRKAVRTLIHRVERGQRKKFYASELSTLLGLTAPSQHVSRARSSSTSSD